MRDSEPEDPEEPTIIATFTKSFIENFGVITVEVTNLDEAKFYDVTYVLGDNKTTQTTGKIDINAKPEDLGQDGDNPQLVFYNGNNTVTIRIYDANNEIIHIFEGVTPVK